ncbi:MAG: hypothetical protein CME06_16675 [Gemmatimonadetes bacterium]|nr:hypothetical protein [Gemmatimonadota bacterium]
MENLAQVRDASEDEIGFGYHLNEIVAAEVGPPEIVPLAQTLWSQQVEDVITAMDFIDKSEGAQVIFV